MSVFALVYGGDSVESEISEVSCEKISKALNKENIPHIKIFLDHFGNFFIENKKKKLKKGFFSKKNTSYYFKTKTKKYFFDVVLPIVHGSGAEDGTIGAYFDTLKIPCIYSGLFNASILQNKFAFKKYLSIFKIPQCKYKKISYLEFMDIGFDLDMFLKGIKAPYIIKPNVLGSSIGVKKAKNKEEVLDAFNEAFLYDTDVIIEEAVSSLKEVNIAVLGYRDEIQLSELETVSEKEEVFSFYDKYLQTREKVKRILPADISEEQKAKIEEIASKAFQIFQCCGVVRFDFLIDKDNGKIYLNEANTIPGSLAEHLFQAKGMSGACLVKEMYRYYLKKEKESKRIFHEYHEGERQKLFSKD